MLHDIAKRGKSVLGVLGLSLYLATVSGSPAAAEPNGAPAGPGAAAPIKPVLAADPAVVARLEALGDNEIIELPPAKIVGDFNDVARKFGTDKTGPRIRNYHYHPAANTWTKTVSVANDSGQAPMGFDVNTVLAYDAVNGICLLYARPGGHKAVDSRAYGLWAYDAAQKKWIRLEPKGQMPPPKDLCTGFFDEARNALVLIRDASTQVWAYRYRKAGK